MLKAVFAIAVVLVLTGRATAAGFSSDMVFAQPSPLFGNAEIVRRMLTPLAAEQLAHELAKMGKSVAGQPIDLSQERFGLYVPQQKPDAGYGLLVFVPPWNEAALPPGWASTLDAAGVIFVTAARSGNDQNVLERRVPLAIAAAANVVAKFPIDPGRIYVGGFSGGARVALRLALAYPDLFHGALIDAGADRIGTAALPLPPASLFAQFRDTSRILFLAGDDDPGALSSNASAATALSDWCVPDARSERLRATGHTIADGPALSHALAALDRVRDQDTPVQADCRAGIEHTLAAALDADEALVAAGKNDQARQRLIETDARFGGLAAPRSIELSRRIP